MPDVLPSCFGDLHGSHASEATSGARSAQNLVTCLYRTLIAGEYRIISITWCKTLMGQGLSVHVDDPSYQLTCHVDMKPWLFWKKQGIKSYETGGGLKVDIIWDLSCAKYGSGPEPYEGYFVAISCDQNVVLLIGDMQREALKKLHVEHVFSQATLISRREHVSGKQVYTTRAQFVETGGTHDIAIECNTGTDAEPRLSVRIDKKVVMQVKRLMWKFRGNQTILIDGLQIEVFWDVHNWLFSSHDGSNGHAVFMFQTCKANEKPWMQTVVSSTVMQDGEMGSNSIRNLDRRKQLLQESLCTSVLNWPKSNSFKNKETNLGPVGFSLLMFAWKNE